LPFLFDAELGQAHVEHFGDLLGGRSHERVG
jgi:hypothetical protein